MKFLNSRKIWIRVVILHKRDMGATGATNVALNLIVEASHNTKITFFFQEQFVGIENAYVVGWLKLKEGHYLVYHLSLK